LVGFLIFAAIAGLLGWIAADRVSRAL